MGIFSNSSDLLSYLDFWCADCVHNHKEFGCPCMTLHVLLTEMKYKKFLNLMIPVKNGQNWKCLFFEEENPSIDADSLNSMNSIRKQIGLDPI